MAVNLNLNLTLDEKIEILKNYDELSINGIIGDCLLRTKAKEKYNMASIMSMNLLATEVAFDMAQRYIDVLEKVCNVK